MLLSGRSKCFLITPSLQDASVLSAKARIVELPAGSHTEKHTPVWVSETDEIETDFSAFLANLLYHSRSLS